MFNLFKKQESPKPSVESELTIEILRMIRSMQESHTQLVESIMHTQQSQSEMMSKWFDMWKAPQGANQSTSLEDREALKALEENTDWLPLDFNVFSDVDK